MRIKVRQTEGTDRIERLQNSAALGTVHLESAGGRPGLHGGNVDGRDGPAELENGNGVVRVPWQLGCRRVLKCSPNMGRTPQQPDDLVEHVTAQVIHDAALMAALFAPLG